MAQRPLAKIDLALFPLCRKSSIARANVLENLSSIPSSWGIHRFGVCLPPL